MRRFRISAAGNWRGRHGLYSGGASGLGNDHASYPRGQGGKSAILYSEMWLSIGKSGNGRRGAGGPADAEKSASGAENARLNCSVRILDVIADRFLTFEKRAQIRQASAVIWRFIGSSGKASPLPRQMDAGGQGEGPVKGQELFVQFASGAVDPQRRFQKKQFPFADNMRNVVVIVWFAQKTVADSRQLDGCFILACSF